jgi:acetate kinase
MMETSGITAKEMNAILNKKSGLLGITGKYIDRRDIDKAANSGDKQSALAIEIEAYRGKKYIGSYLAALGHTDALIFTAGVGEMSSTIRGKMIRGCEELGILMDEEKNSISRTRNAETVISDRGSRIKVFVIPTDEELVMVEDTVALLEGKYDIHTSFTYSFQDPLYVNKLREEAFKKELEENPELSSVRAPVPGR